nr:MFS transporter [Haloglomus irregulare]
MGSERTVVPALTEDVLGVESFLVIGSFAVSFGVVKSLLNLYAGKYGEEYGPKPVLVAGWATALPLPVILIFAPNWGWLTAGNILLGVNQALTWSMGINAKIYLAGPDQRGLAVGTDEAFDSTGVAVEAWITGIIAGQWSLRPEPLYSLAVVVVLAFLISIFIIKETVQYARAEGDDDHHDANPPFDEVLTRATYGDRTLFAAAQAGHIENFADTLF